MLFQNHTAIQNMFNNQYLSEQMPKGNMSNMLLIPLQRRARLPGQTGRMYSCLCCPRCRSMLLVMRRASRRHCAARAPLSWRVTAQRCGEQLWRNGRSACVFPMAAAPGAWSFPLQQVKSLPVAVFFVADLGIENNNLPVFSLQTGSHMV